MHFAVEIRPQGSPALCTLAKDILDPLYTKPSSELQRLRKAEDRSYRMDTSENTGYCVLRTLRMHENYHAGSLSHNCDVGYAKHGNTHTSTLVLYALRSCDDDIGIDK